MRLLVDPDKESPELLDPSDVCRPEAMNGEGKAEGQFRTFSDDSPLVQRVKDTYYNMHTHQTVEFVENQHEKWLKFNHMEATIMEALEMLNNLVDESDPDLDMPNIVHAFQTAEQIRKVHPKAEWFQLVGLIHDLGKIMAFFDEPQWAVVGDTFPVGCGIQKSIVYSDWSFKDNKDLDNPRYNTLNGMYRANCGLDNVLMSWGHDEYFYQVLIHNNTSLPKEGLDMIRFHSFYPWHTGGDYTNLMNYDDKLKMKWVREFNKFDLYTKCTVTPDIEMLKPYYQRLIDKYIPGVIKF